MQLKLFGLGDGRSFYIAVCVQMDFQLVRVGYHSLGSKGRIQDPQMHVI